MLTDKNIIELGEKIISPFDANKVQVVCYDLTAASFHPDESSELKEITLQPMESVFIKSKEKITLPDNISASVILRNSRIRQGLHLEAPLYFPGHETIVYYRITNVSGNSITLKEGDCIAAITFNQLPESVDKPYSGGFQKEIKFSGMGKYRDVYASAIKSVKKEKDKLKNLESRLYGNVLALLAIFVAAFSILNVNVSLAQKAGVEGLMTFNLSTVGSICILMSLVQYFLPNESEKRWEIAFVGIALIIGSVIVGCGLS